MNDDAAPPVWSPLAVPMFRAVWLAGLVSNLGTWMHMVAAQWQMTSLTSSPAAVGLIATVSALPAFALALPAGALADVVDRRKLILVSQCWQAVTAGGLGVLTVAGAVTPYRLLAATLLLSVGANLSGPAMMAVPIELVDRRHLPAVTSLNSLSGTLSQAVGPAVGGLLVAGAGSGAVFLLNAASFAGTIVVFAAWRRRPATLALPPEHVSSAVRSGLRYLASAPDLRRVLARLSAHVLGFSLVPAALPVLARTDLGTGSGGFGFLLACLGAGGVAGAAVLPRLRGRFGPDAVAAAASAVVAVAVVGLAAVPDAAVAAPVMVVLGAANMAVVSSIMIAVQAVLPAWVRGRGLAVMALVFQGSIAVGAAAWAAVVTELGPRPAFVLAGVVVALAALIGFAVRFQRLESADTTLAGFAPEPCPPASVAVDDGPVQLRVVYRVDGADVERFREAAVRLRRARQRNGATRWQLAADVHDPDRHVESFTVATWSEHLRQAERATRADQRLIAEVAAFHVGLAAPEQEALVSERHHHWKGHRNG